MKKCCVKNACKEDFCDNAKKDACPPKDEGGKCCPPSNTEMKCFPQKTAKKEPHCGFGKTN
jgi:hypothetical protein